MSYDPKIKAYVDERGGLLYKRFTYYDENGERKYKLEATGLEAKGNKRRVEAELEADIAALEYSLTHSDPSLVYFIDFMLRNEAEHSPELEKSTQEANKVNIDSHIVPYFKDKNYMLTDLTPTIIHDFYLYLSTSGNVKTGEGLATATTKKIASIIKGTLNAAYVRGLIPTDPSLKVPVPKNKGKQQVKKVYMTKEEAQKVLDAFKGSPLEGIVYMTLFYGLRKSEVLGLKWKYIDFENNTFQIQSTIVKHTTVIEKESPKTDESEAVFQLLPRYRELLLEIKEEQGKNKKLLGEAYQDSDYVFCHPNGKYFRPDSINKMFRKRLEKCGLPRMRFHDLRHINNMKTPLLKIRLKSHISPHYSTMFRKIYGAFLNIALLYGHTILKSLEEVFYGREWKETLRYK